MLYHNKLIVLLVALFVVLLCVGCNPDVKDGGSNVDAVTLTTADKDKWIDVSSNTDIVIEGLNPYEYYTIRIDDASRSVSRAINPIDYGFLKLTENLYAIMADANGIIRFKGLTFISGKGKIQFVIPVKYNDSFTIRMDDNSIPYTTDSNGNREYNVYFQLSLKGLSAKEKENLMVLSENIFGSYSVKSYFIFRKGNETTTGSPGKLYDLSEYDDVTYYQYLKVNSNSVSYSDYLLSKLVHPTVWDIANSSTSNITVDSNLTLINVKNLNPNVEYVMELETSDLKAITSSNFSIQRGGSAPRNDNGNVLPVLRDMTPEGGTTGLYYIGNDAVDFYFDYSYREYKEGESVGKLKIRPITTEEKNNIVFFDIPSNLSTITKTIDLSSWTYKEGNTYYIPIYFDYPGSKVLFNMYMVSDTSINYTYKYVNFDGYRSIGKKQGNNTNLIEFHLPQTPAENKYARHIFLEITTTNPKNLIFKLDRIDTTVSSPEGLAGSWKTSISNSNIVLNINSGASGVVKRTYFENRTPKYYLETTFTMKSKNSGNISLSLFTDPLHYNFEPTLDADNKYVAHIDSILFNDTFRRSYDANDPLIGTWKGDSSGRELCFKTDNTYTMKIGENLLEGTYYLDETNQIIMLYPEDFTVDFPYSITSSTLTLGEYVFNKQ